MPLSHQALLDRHARGRRSAFMDDLSCAAYCAPFNFDAHDEGETTMPQYAGYIDNEFVLGRGAQLTVEDPSNESELASFPGLSVTQIESAITSARRVFDRGDTSGFGREHGAEGLRMYQQLSCLTLGG